MAGKSLKPQGKSNRNGKSPSKATPARASQKANEGAAGKKPAVRTSGLVKKAAPQKTSTSTRKTSSPRTAAVNSGLSVDRKLDILGIVLALGGILSVLSLMSVSNGSITASWELLLSRAFGWGKYLFPFGMLAAGLWLILRKFERIPQLAVERLAGLFLLFLNVLAWFHFLSYIQEGINPMELAALGTGGGYIGGGILYLLLGALGRGGTAIALIAWSLISLALTLDRTIIELFNWASPIVSGAWRRFLESWPQPAGQAGQTPPDYGGVLATPPARPAGSLAHAPLAQTAPAGMEPNLVTEARPWVLPRLDEILEAGREAVHDDDVDRQRSQIIEETLTSFGAPVRVVEINRGPTITQFGVEPDFVESRGGRMRVRVGKIAALADDLALALSARTIRIQAPVPGRGFVGIEVPNDEISTVALRDVIESEGFKRIRSPLGFALGQNVAGMAVSADLAAMPHLLIAGQTGSGKSVCVNALICCLLMNNTPDELRLLMVDPKRVELTGYNGIPHLLAPVVVEMERVVAALQWVTREMDMRYRKLSEVGARNIVDYNQKVSQRGGIKIPYLVVIIDELADLMMLAPDETEKTITRLAQLARATGIHLVIATQRPSVDVVTGLIKANFPARIAFAVASGVDSRTILDSVGAERLLGRGDMLFLPPDAPAPVRLQGVFVSDAEIQSLVQYWQGFSSTAATTQVAVGGIVDVLPSSVPLKQLPMWEEVTEAKDTDPLLNESIDLVRRQGRASISMLQRRLRVGYTRAARLVETMEERGIVGPPEPGTGTREVLDYGQAAPPVDEN